MIRLTRQQIREVDRLAIDRYRIPGIVLMENAAIGVAEVVSEMLDGNCIGQILIVCGGGNNGGDGLAVARHLHNRGADVTIALAIDDPGKYHGDARINWDIAQAMNLSVETFDASIIEQARPLLIIDAIFGTGLQQPPRPPFGVIAEAINSAHVPVLAIDLPSGLDCDTGRPLGDAVVIARRTVTFVAPKIGFDNPEAARYLGEVTVADIGCPVELPAAVLGAAVGGLDSDARK